MEQSDLIENGIKIITRSLIEPSLPTIPTAYFYGPPGLGLSDLIVRLINEIKTLSWSINVYHQNANVFTRHIISVIEENKLNGFREHLFSQDVVIIENLGFLRGRSATMSLLSELIDELKEKGKLFVGTGEEHPLELFQANDLGKKIMQGPVMAVPQTSESLRYKFVLGRAREHKAELRDEVSKYLAQEISDVRILESAVNLAINYQKLNSTAIDLSTIKKMVRIVPG